MDLVERLRGLHQCCPEMAAAREAADEIERLHKIARDAVVEQGKLATKLAAIEHNIWERQDAADREIERLREGLREEIDRDPAHGVRLRRLLGELDDKGRTA